MKADVFRAEQMVVSKREQVLAGVLLRVHAAHRGVRLDMHRIARRERLVRLVQHRAVFLAAVRNARAVHHAGIAALAAALGKERRAVGLHVEPAVLPRRAGHDGRRTGQRLHAFKIQLFTAHCFFLLRLSGAPRSFPGECVY